MSAEGQTIREALDELCSACAENPRVGRIPERIAALEARLAEAEGYEHTLTNTALELEARLAEAERALREIAQLDISVGGWSGWFPLFRKAREIARAALPSESETS